MDEPGTVFCLVPQDIYADGVRDQANRSRRRDNPNDPSRPFLRIGFDQPSKVPGKLTRFGRMRETNDVILGKHWSMDDQCYFDVDRATGEVLLHDISSRSNTKLWNEDIPNLIRQSPRICVVPLIGEWNFTIGCATFRLIPRITRNEQDVEAFAEERMAFVRDPVPEEYEGTHKGTPERLEEFDLQSRTSMSTYTYDTRVRPLSEDEEEDEIIYRLVKQLGQGNQGQVYEVVDVNTSELYACKIMAYKGPIPQWDVQVEKDLKERIKKEVKIVREVNHAYIVPYTRAQGLKTFERPVEIFMPVYEGSLHDWIQRHKDQGQEAIKATMGTVLYQILLALDHVHTREPQIIHRDIKPANILFRGNDFFLTDFGIAKVVDMSRTIAGSPSYMAPEVWMSGDQTPKVDIYALGATVVVCLQESLPETEPRVTWQNWQQWHQHLQTLANQHAPQMAPMLTDVADQRPTARDLLDAFFPQPAHALQGPRNGITPSSFGVSSPLTNQVNGTTTIYSAAPNPMEWTRTGATAFFQEKPWPNPGAVRAPQVPPNRPAQPGPRRKGSVKSAKSVNEMQKKGHKRGGSSQNTPSQSAGVPKRTSRRQRSRSKSIRKTQEVRVLGMA